MSSLRSAQRRLLRAEIPLTEMRRALLSAIVALLMADASGITSLLEPEICAIGTNDSLPDSGCPAFCVRCTCACCASSVEYSAPLEIAVAALPPRAVALPTPATLPTGNPADILHVPKTLLT